jgi:hypothetical protein
MSTSNCKFYIKHFRTTTHRTYIKAKYVVGPQHVKVFLYKYLHTFYAVLSPKGMTY